MPNDKQVSQLLKGAKAWNGWREENSHDLIDLHQAYLASGPALTGVNLWAADLYKADLTGAILNNAILDSADLSYAQLERAGLESANLHKALLRNTNLRNAYMKNTDLRNAELAGADLTGARHLQVEQLHKAHLEQGKTLILPNGDICSDLSTIKPEQLSKNQRHHSNGQPWTAAVSNTPPTPSRNGIGG